MPDLLHVLAHRRSIRRYQPRPLERETLMRVLEGARAAPSAGNLQAYQIVVVEDEERRRMLARAALDQEHVAEAPVTLVFLEDRQASAAKYGRRGAELYALQDATIACTHALLAAEALDLGSCWIGAFLPARVSALINAPAHLRPVALLTLGHPAESPAPPARHPMEAVVRWETY